MTILILLFLGGLLLGGQFMTYSIICDINPLSVTGMATGFQNMFCLMSGVIFQPLIGQILDWLWEESYENGVRLYSVIAYQEALSSVLVALAIATLTSLFIKEAYPTR